MKGERRHELETNELSKLTERAKPIFEKYGHWMIIGVAVVLISVAGWMLYEKYYTDPYAEGWTKLAAAESAEDYENLAEDEEFADSPVAAWAQLMAAESHLKDGVEESFSDMKAAVNTLDLALEGFEELLDRDDVADEIRERALYGRATALEVLSKKDTKKAVAAYEELLDEFPESVFAQSAQERIDALKSSDSKQFYVWFHDPKRKPADRPAPRDGMNTNPFDPSNLFPQDHPLPSELVIPDHLRLPDENGAETTNDSADDNRSSENDSDVDSTTDTDGADSDTAPPSSDDDSATDTPPSDDNDSEAQPDAESDEDSASEEDSTADDASSDEASSDNPDPGK